MKILVVDGNNLIARNTMVFPAAVNQDGKATGGIYGTIMMIRNYLAQDPHDAVMFALDWGRPQFRVDLCPEYKAQREGDRTPEEERTYRLYKEQCKYCHEVLTPLGLVTARAKGWEGDDVIAALTLHRLPDHQCTIYSSDKDYTQLVDGDRVKFWDLTSQGFIQPDPKYALKKCMDPKASDNLDGVPGVGPAKSQWLVDQSNATTPEPLIAWCVAHAADPQFKKGQLKIINAVVAEQQKVRANWQCSKLSLVAGKCNEELKFRRTAPDKPSFVEACKAYYLRPIVQDSHAVFAPFSTLTCPV